MDSQSDIEENIDIEESHPLPVISIIGRPNVGKSTLFNRLTRTRKALVADIPGTTRDRKEQEVRWGNYHFLLVDTGGMDFGSSQHFSTDIRAQIEAAVESSDMVWMIVDIKEGLNPYDKELFRYVSRSTKPYLVLANKADNTQREQQLAEFFRLGTERLISISANHGMGVENALEETALSCPNIIEINAEDVIVRRDAEHRPTRVAFIGRPNVGKSSMVNRIIGQSRMIVSPLAGTTREAVEIPLQIYDRPYVLVDTAGIRRKARTTEYLEKIGVLQSIGALNRVDVAVLVMDAGEDAAMQDARIANYIQDHRCAVVVAMNKWDTVAKGVPKKKQQEVFKNVEEDTREKFRFIDHAAFIRTNALDGSGFRKLFSEIDRAAAQFQRKIQTADLNRVVQAAMLRSPPPGRGRTSGKVYYGLQLGSRPPTFRFFTSYPDKITDAYTRFMENQLRFHFGFKGSPIRIQWRGKESKK